MNDFNTMFLTYSVTLAQIAFPPVLKGPKQ
jgi:hypothetical protein